MERRLHLCRLVELQRLKDMESDKGLVLTFTSLIEATIQEIIKAFLVPNAASSQYIKRTSTASITNQVLLTCSLGLIYEQEMKVINKLCEIRNKFAHNWDVNFGTPEVQKKVLELKDMWFKFDDKSNQQFQLLADREIFDKIAFMLLQDLVHRAEEVSHHGLTLLQWSTTWQRKMDG